MPISQILLATVSGGGGTPPPPLPASTLPTLTATGGSLYFDPSNQDQLLDTSLSTDYQIGLGDYTVEWWQWMLDSSGAFPRPFSMGTYPNAFFGVSLENAVLLWANGSVVLSASYTKADLYDTWAHFAITRSAGTTRVFLNGVEIGSNTAAYDVQSLTSFAIGNESQRSLGASFGGYIKDFRLVKGAAIYTSTFTPPIAPLTVTSETKVLLSVNSDLAKHTDATGTHTFDPVGATYADVGPYDLALYVDAANVLSINPGVSLATWNDLSPANNDLTLTNVTWSNVNGGRIVFESGGTQGYAESTSTIASVQNGITPRASVSFWAYVTNTGGYQHIAGMRGGNKFHVLNFGDGSIFECRVETGNGYWDNYPQIGARLNTMTHYAFVVNGTRSDFYINGVLSSTAEGITGPFMGTLGAFTIAQAAGGFQATNLEMGELRYYNRARSPKEIAAEFAATRTRYGV